MGHHMITRSKNNKNHLIPNIEQVQLSPRKRRGRKKHSDLPVEITTEILSWLSIECLIKCQCVCKQWHELIQDRNFIEKHMIRKAKLVYHPINQKDNGETFQRITSLDGLVLERGNFSRKYRIRNSKMHRVFDLPETDYETAMVLMSFVRRSGCYKVVSLFGCFIYGGIEVLTLGNEEKPTWKTIDTNIFSDYYIHKENYRVLFSDEIGYFLRTITESEDIYEVICLNLENESFSSTILPRSLFPDIKNVHVMMWGNCFSVFEIVNYKLNVLVLEDYKKGKWAKKKIVIPLKFLKKNQDMNSENVLPYHVSLDKNLIWFAWKKGCEDLHKCTYFSYSTKSEKILYKFTTPYGKNYVVKESLVTFKGMRPWAGYKGLEN